MATDILIALCGEIEATLVGNSAELTEKLNQLHKIYVVYLKLVNTVCQLHSN